MLPNIHRDDDGKRRRQCGLGATAAAAVYAVNSLNCWVMKCQKPKCYSHSISLRHAEARVEAAATAAAAVEANERGVTYEDGL